MSLYFLVFPLNFKLFIFPSHIILGLLKIKLFFRKINWGQGSVDCLSFSIVPFRLSLQTQELFLFFSSSHPIETLTPQDHKQTSHPRSQRCCSSSCARSADCHSRSLLLRTLSLSLTAGRSVGRCLFARSPLVHSASLLLCSVAAFSSVRLCFSFASLLLRSPLFTLSLSLRHVRSLLLLTLSLSLTPAGSAVQVQLTRRCLCCFEYIVDLLCNLCFHWEKQSKR